MDNVKKVQTETMWEVEYDGKIYSVMQIEDSNFESGFYSWEVWDEDTNLVVDYELELNVINEIIQNF